MQVFQLIITTEPSITTPGWRSDSERVSGKKAFWLFFRLLKSKTTVGSGTDTIGKVIPNYLYLEQFEDDDDEGRGRRTIVITIAKDVDR